MELGLWLLSVDLFCILVFECTSQFSDYQPSTVLLASPADKQESSTPSLYALNPHETTDEGLRIELAP